MRGKHLNRYQCHFSNHRSTLRNFYWHANQIMRWRPFNIKTIFTNKAFMLNASLLKTIRSLFRSWKLTVDCTQIDSNSIQLSKGKIIKTDSKWTLTFEKTNSTQCLLSKSVTTNTIRRINNMICGPLQICTYDRNRTNRRSMNLSDKTIYACVCVNKPMDKINQTCPKCTLQYLFRKKKIPCNNSLSLHYNIYIEAFKIPWTNSPSLPLQYLFTSI